MDLHIDQFSVLDGWMSAGVGTSWAIGTGLAGGGRWWNCLFQWYLEPVSA